MIKRLKSLILIGIAAATVATTVSFGYFYFSDVTSNHEINHDVKYDDIFENYSNINASLGYPGLSDKQYQIYIFPSAEYYDIYMDYLNGKSTIKPEDYIGYMTPKMLDDGNVYKDPNTGKPQYTMHPSVNRGLDTKGAYPTDAYVKRVEGYNIKRQNDKQWGDHYYTTTVERHAGSNYRYYSLAKDQYDTLDYQSFVNVKSKNEKSKNYYYEEHETKARLENGGWWFSRLDGLPKGLYFLKSGALFNSYTVNGGTYLQTDAAYAKLIYQIYDVYSSHYGRSYGNPNDALLPYKDFKGYLDFKQDGLTPETTQLSQAGKRTLFSTDRFGYWKDLSFEEGRFMPIRLDVINSISPQVFEDSYLNIGTSMQDGNVSPWFDVNFCNFTYVNHYDPNLTHDNDGNGVESPYEDLEPKLNEVALKKPYRIRAKDFFGTYDLNNLFDINKNLARYADDDGIIRLFPTFSNSKGYQGNSQGSNDNRLGGKDAVRFDITQGEAGETIRRQPVWRPAKDNTNHSVTYPASNMPGSKTVDLYYCALNNIPICYDNQKTNLKIEVAFSSGNANWEGQWTETFLYDFTPQNSSTLLNGVGYYNFFVFVEDAGKEIKGKYEPFKIEEYLKEPDSKNPKSYDFMNKFSRLDGKRFSYLGPNLDSSNKNVIPGKQRAIYMLAERVVTPKFYIDIKNDSTIDDINAKVEKDFSAANTGFTFDNPIFDVDINGQVLANKENQLYTSNSTELNKKGYYRNENNMFLFKAVNFMEVDNGACQFRMGTHHNPNLKVSNNGIHREIAVQTGFDDKKKEYIYQRFEPIIGEFGFFETKEIDSGIVQDGVMLKDTILTLKDETCRGVYDILICLDKTDVGNDPSKAVGNFHVYAYRHTNIFVKLYGKVEFNTIVYDGAPFIDHKSIDPIWTKTFYIGQTVARNDYTDPDYVEFVHVLENYLTSPEAKARNINQNNLMVRDRITRSPIAWYDQNTLLWTINQSFRITKNYIFYIENMTDASA